MSTNAKPRRNPRRKPVKGFVDTLAKLGDVSAITEGSPDAPLFKIERELLAAERRKKAVAADLLEIKKLAFEYDEEKDGPLLDDGHTHQDKEEVMKRLENQVVLEVRWSMVREKWQDSELPPELLKLEKEEKKLEARIERLKEQLIDTPAKTIEGILLKQRRAAKSSPRVLGHRGKPTLTESILADLEALAAQ